MNLKKGFSLIEFLVVLAVVTLLTAMLMPAISNKRAIAKLTLCQSNLKQWGIIATLYTNENDGKFMSGSISDATLQTFTTAAWTTTLSKNEDINDIDKRVWFCPEARKTEAQGAAIKNPACAWDYKTSMVNQQGQTGSYGINLWVYNVPKPATVSNGWRGTLRMGSNQEDDHWKTTNIPHADRVPMFLDSWWPGGRPESLQDFSGTLATDSPTKGQYLTNGPPATTVGGAILNDSYHNNDEMAHFVVDRHLGNVNCVFVDNSVRLVGLKELWALKWHKRYNTQNNYMRKLYSENPTYWEPYINKSKAFYTWQ